MKIKIKDKGFSTTHFGYLEPNKEYDLPEHFANYCVKKMQSAVFMAANKKQIKRTSRKVK